jgi:hypothetical protein
VNLQDITKAGQTRVTRLSCYPFMESRAQVGDPALPQLPARQHRVYYGLSLQLAGLLLACGTDDASTGSDPCFVAEQRPRTLSHVKSITFASIAPVERIFRPRDIAFEMTQ